MRSFLLFVLLSIVNVCSAQQYWQPPSGIREIPVPNLPDIAIASLDYNGPVIYYNPVICQQVGALATAFFEAHEYGHHYLGHVLQHYINANNPYVQGWLTLNAESDADAYAVRYWIAQGNKAIIQAGASAMWNINNAGDQSHPPSRVRSANISNYYYQLTGTPLF